VGWQPDTLFGVKSFWKSLSGEDWSHPHYSTRPQSLVGCMRHPSGLRTYIYKVILFLIQHVQNNDQWNASHKRIVHAGIIRLKFWDTAWGHVVCKTCWCSVGDLSWLAGAEVGMVYTLIIWPNYSAVQTYPRRKREDTQLFISEKKSVYQLPHTQYGSLWWQHPKNNKKKKGVEGRERMTKSLCRQIT